VYTFPNSFFLNLKFAQRKINILTCYQQKVWKLFSSGKVTYDSFEYLIYWLWVIRSRREKHARDWMLRCFSASRTTVILCLWCAQHASKASLLCEKLAFDIAVSIFLIAGNPHIKICHYKAITYL